jgi:ABC-2 type transport system permease protein
MTAMGVSTARTAAAGTSPARMRDLIPAEWIKFSSLRSSLVSLAVIVACALYSAHDSSRSWIAMTGNGGPQALPDFDLGQTVFFAPFWLLLMAAVGAIGAMTVGAEHASGLIRTTLTAVPDRRRVVAAKIVVVAGVTAVAGFVSGAGSLAIGRVELAGRVSGITMTDDAAVRGMVVSTLLFPVCALAGMALATVVRNTAATVFTVVATFGFLPLLFKQDDSWWSVQGTDDMPCFAWFRLVVAAKGKIADPHITSVTHAWVTLAVWPVASILVTATVLQRRDV